LTTNPNPQGVVWRSDPQTGDLAPFVNERAVQRFWSNVDQSGGADSCWEWKLGRNTTNYGLVRVQGRLWRAHRLAVLLDTGELSEASVVIHACDNPPCCNPKHLKAGTRQENTLDMVSKGRHKKPTTFVPARFRLPRKNHRLTREQVAQVREQLESPMANQSAIGRAFGVSSGCISAIARGTSWKDSVDVGLSEFDLRIGYRIDKTLEGCWPWPGSKNRSGYGTVQYHGKSWMAHRLSYFLTTGETIPEGRVILHSCDNPACVRPDHLKTGTHAENASDKIIKGRASVPRGERHYAARLSEKDVVEIRASSDSARSIADRLGINTNVVYRVRTRRTWKHVA